MRRSGAIHAFIAHRFQYGLLSLSKRQQHGRFNEKIWCPNGNLLLESKAGSKLHTLKDITVKSVFSLNLSFFSTQRNNLARRRRQYLTPDLSPQLRKQIVLNIGQNAYCGKRRHCFNLTQVCPLIYFLTAFLMYKLRIKMGWISNLFEIVYFPRKSSSNLHTLYSWQKLLAYDEYIYGMKSSCGKGYQTY